MLKNETATASSKAESIDCYVAAAAAAHEIGLDPYNFKGKLLATLLSFSPSVLPFYFTVHNNMEVSESIQWNVQIISLVERAGRTLR